MLVTVEYISELHCSLIAALLFVRSSDFIAGSIPITMRPVSLSLFIYLCVCLVNFFFKTSLFRQSWTDSFYISHESSLAGPSFGLCFSWRFGDIWRFGALFYFRQKLVLYIRKHAIKSDVTITGLTNYKVSEEYLRVRMSESMADSDVYTAFCELLYWPKMTVFHPEVVEIIHKSPCTKCWEIKQRRLKTFVIFAMPWHLNERCWDIWDMGSIGTNKGHYCKWARFTRGQWLSRT